MAHIFRHGTFSSTFGTFVHSLHFLLYTFEMASRKEKMITMLPTKRRQLPPYPFPISHELIRQINILNRPIGTRQTQRIIPTRIQLGIGRDRGTIVAVPPLVVRALPRREGDAGNIAAGRTGTRPAVGLDEQCGGDHDEYDTEDEAGESDDCVTKAGEEGRGNAEEVGGESLHGGEATQESVAHASEVGEVINEGCEADEAVDDNVEEEPQQHLHVARATALLGGIDVLAEEEVPIDGNVGQTGADEAEDPPRGTDANVLG